MSRKRASTLLIFMLACLNVVNAQDSRAVMAPAARLMVEETPPEWLIALLGKACDPRASQTDAADEEMFAISPDCRRVAYIARGNGGARVVLDGQAQERYESILAGTLTFSPDGSRFAYGARKAGKSLVVVDGQEGKAYDDVLRDTLVFSPDGKRFAYGVEDGGRCFIVCDNKEERRYDAILEDSPIFSPDGKQLAYSAMTGDKAVVVVNGVEGQAYQAVLQGTLRFSADGRITYGAMKEDKALVVVFGREERLYDGILQDTPVLSPDGRRVAYGVRRGKKRLVVVDGKEGKEYDLIVPGSLVFSPDGRRLAYVAQSGRQSLVVVDGKEDEAYDRIVAGPVFSPNGGRLVYAAARGARVFLVINGRVEEDRGYEDVKHLTFSGDGKKMAFAAKKGGGWFVVADGEAQKTYDHVSGLTFSPDSRELAYIAYERGQAFTVVAGSEGERYDGILSGPGRGIVYDTLNFYHYLAVRRNRLYLAGNYPQFPPDDELEAAIATLRRVKTDAMDEIEKWRRLQAIDRAWSVITSRGEQGRVRVLLELDRVRTVKESDDFFKLNAAALLWRIGRLEHAGVIAEQWRTTTLSARYEYVFYPAYEAAQTGDERALPMLQACLQDDQGRIFLGEQALHLDWPLTKEIIWGVYGAKGFPVLAGLLETATDARVLRSALSILGKAMYAPALPQVRKLAGDSREEVRGMALVCLGRFGHPDDYQLLAAGLGEKVPPADAPYRIYGLAAYGDLRAVPVLLSLANLKGDDQTTVRLAALDALKVLLTADSLNALRKQAGSGKTEAERASCREFLAFFQDQTGIGWNEFDRGSRKWREDVIAGFRERATALAPGTRALTREEFLEVVDEWKRSRSISGSACGWVRLGQIIPAARASDLDRIYEVRAAILTRLTPGALLDLRMLDALLMQVVRSEYRREPGITAKVEAR